MTTRVPVEDTKMKPETIESIQELIHGLNDSVKYHSEAADVIDDNYVKQAFLTIAAERKKIAEKIGEYVAQSDAKPEEDGTFLGSLRTIWTSLRGGLNSGDATVVLIEAERAEDVIVNKFKNVLPEIAGSPINDTLNQCFTTVKSGHDRVLGLRNAYQKA